MFVFSSGCLGGGKAAPRRCGSLWRCSACGCRRLARPGARGHIGVAVLSKVGGQSGVEKSRGKWSMVDNSGVEER